ncbi:piggyBac transposable element-derived protein 4-like [Solea solea]|uniref:piggyBac transposable element-derived protein 4-like n=1 Tax=Solea solea TaxID=90069 RepID=UPI00272AFD0B|nr:piggyBac transposable element-derived protein 4-like [Solea solea]
MIISMSAGSPHDTLCPIQAAESTMQADSEPAEPEESEKASNSEDEEDEGLGDVPDHQLASDFSLDSSESENEEPTGEGGWISKSRNIVWSPTENQTVPYEPDTDDTDLKPGPTLWATSKMHSLESAFDLFITEEIVNVIVEMTNSQGRHKVPDWRDIDATELRAFIGILLLTGVYKSTNESMRSLWNAETGRSIFRATMSIRTFNRINSTLKFGDSLNKTSSHTDDKLAKFRCIWDRWTHRLGLLFNPGQDVCVGEHVVPFRGCCAFRQYINNPARYGIKIWVTCDVETSYAWRMQIDIGKPADGSSGFNKGHRVGLEMTEGLRGNTVTCDKVLTSYELAEELLNRKMTLVGAIRKSKPEIPPQLLLTKTRQTHSSLFAFTRTHTAVSYIPKLRKNVLLLSTKHHERAVSNTEKMKPLIIMDYDRCKGCVDNLDKVIATYSCRKRTHRWPLVLFYHLLDISVYNAYVLWTAVDPTWNKAKTYRRRTFIEELGKTLVAPHMARRPRLPREASAVAMIKELQDREPISENYNPRRRGTCDFCTGKRKRCTMSCSKCGRFVCKVHSTCICNSCRFCPIVNLQ